MPLYRYIGGQVVQLPLGPPAVVTPGDAFVLGTTRPDATNTGLTGPTTSTVTGSSTTVTTFSTANQTVSNVRFETYVKITAAGVTFTNCEFVGPAAYGGYPGQGGFIQVAATGVVFTRCRIAMRDPAYYQTAYDGYGATFVRCDISQCTDLLSIKPGAPTVAQGCFLHDQVFFDGQGGMANSQNGSDHTNDDRWPGWEHNDIAQIYGGDGHTIEGCSLQAFFTTRLGTPNTAMNGIAASGTRPDGGTFNNGGRKFPNRNYLHVIFVGPEQARVTNLRIKNNWIGGGEVHFQASPQGNGYDTGNTALIDGNRIDLTIKGGNYRDDAANPKIPINYIASMGTFTIDGQGNVWDPTSSAVPASLQGQPIDSSKSGSSQVQYAVST